jgi:hypothetical protein
MRGARSRSFVTRFLGFERRLVDRAVYVSWYKDENHDKKSQNSTKRYMGACSCSRYLGARDRRSANNNGTSPAWIVPPLCTGGPAGTEQT